MLLSYPLASIYLWNGETAFLLSKSTFGYSGGRYDKRVKYSTVGAGKQRTCQIYQRSYSRHSLTSHRTSESPWFSRLRPESLDHVSWLRMLTFSDVREIHPLSQQEAHSCAIWTSLQTIPRVRSLYAYSTCQPQQNTHKCISYIQRCIMKSGN